MKYRKRKNGFLILLLSLLFIISNCRKMDDSLTGNWQGVLTIDISHQHEEYQEWEEIIQHENEPDEVITHVEHITWTMTGRVVMEFGFNLEEPLYDARINGRGSGRQEIQFNGPTQCQLNTVESPEFAFSVFGTVDSSTFNLQVVPDAVPVIFIQLQCQNVRVQLPVYGIALLNVISNLRLDIPVQDGSTTGGSGTSSVGTGYGQMAYIYNLTLNQR